jgi:hypothetical protein
VYVGAGIEARDRVVGIAGELANRYGSRTAVEKEIKRSRREVESDLKKFERRGNTARNQLERDVRKARTRLEREVRNRRKVVTGRVDDAVQASVGVASLAKDRVASLA